MADHQQITCINCPVGCRMDVTLENGVVTAVTGNTCKRGDTYARQECVRPMRMVTAVVAVRGADTPLSVKTRQPIPRKDIQACMQALQSLSLCAPVRMGDTVLENVAGTGVDVIATKDVSARA